MQIIVLGMHRSGTSLITRLINMMGAYFGPEGISIGFNKDNPKGFWERRDVMQLNDAILSHFNCSWRKIDRFEDNKVDALPPLLQRNIRQVVLSLDAYRPWVLKDPRLCLTLPYWLPALEVPVAVIAWRDPLEAARSLELRNGLSIEHGLSMWEYHAVHTIRHAHALPKVFASHATMLSDPIAGLRRLHDGLVKEDVLGLRLPSAREITAFVEPKLHRAHKEQVNHTLSDHQKTLSSMLRGDTPFDKNVQVSDESKRVMQSIEINREP